MKEVKNTNKNRVKSGQEPVFKKKREMKNMRYEQQFDQLEKEGKLDKYMRMKEEENDKKRQRAR